MLLKRKEMHEEREYFRTGIVASAIYNSNRGKKQKPLKPEDFMPKKKKKKSTWQDQLKFVEMLNSVFGGDDKRNKESSNTP